MTHSDVVCVKTNDEHVVDSQALQRLSQELGKIVGKWLAEAERQKHQTNNEAAQNPNQGYEPGSSGLRSAAAQQSLPKLSD